MILNYINNKVTQEYILSCINSGDVYGVNASEIEDNLNIVRNNASTILNELWKTSKLIKINTRPVTFVPVDVIQKIYISSDSSLKDTYTLEQLNNLITSIKCENISIDLVWNF